MTTDDEAQTVPAQEEPQQQQSGEQRKSFWDWLFGSGEERKPAPNPAPQDNESGAN
jgi:hypothetical protein